MKEKTKRYCTAFACIPDLLEPYAILSEDVGDKEYMKICKDFYKMKGIKTKIIRVEILEVLKK